MIRTILAFTAAASVLLGGAAAAAAPARLHTDLTLTYMAEAGYATAVTLRCDPPGGAHPKPSAACRTLRTVGGQPARLKPVHIMCTMIYAPITAQITGRWRGKKINWSKTYGNTCEMTRATGVLFRF
jgi:Subtilisin inhibitor-like